MSSSSSYGNAPIKCFLISIQLLQVLLFSCPFTLTIYECLIVGEPLYVHIKMHSEVATFNKTLYKNKLMSATMKHSKRT
jgi:hypothetical protein